MVRSTMAANNNGGSQGSASKENPLSISWHDSAWIPMLSPANVLDYFSERTNPFYDKSCNNEIIKMQRLSPEQLNNMTGVEYILLHAQEPILYVVRKQHRHSQQQVTPLADYYIIAGVVYQAPDLYSVLNSRLLTSLHNIQSAFDEALSYSRYHPSKGYWWEFKDKEDKKRQDKSKSQGSKKKPEEMSSAFQRQRVDMLLGELADKFPPKFAQPKRGDQPVPVEEDRKPGEQAAQVKEEKSEDTPNQNHSSSGSRSNQSMQPPEKRMKLSKQS
ncbi:PREDICTED: mediator of RNA polymerase II transcription subunit 6-like [Branchiostoma belcheri]|uniref:Mediator of RNA polymerase II transcription subunit 6 n=1 Tax=Branchiostoma belcheri TaxID=7741 RepID=A0A6P4YT16_BRABE|nr:PREDICTED: mediator of RNA polymerase II transcription subunit 6-like [Branchiostoma belcheri]